MLGTVLFLTRGGGGHFARCEISIPPLKFKVIKGFNMHFEK